VEKTRENGQRTHKIIGAEREKKYRSALEVSWSTDGKEREREE